MTDNLLYGKPSGKTVEYLDRYFTSIFRNGYVTCKDTVLPEYYTHFGDQICKMKIRSDDIWVCSFPKTGSTWTQEMVWCIANNVDLTAAKIELVKRFQFLEGFSIFDLRHLPNIGDSIHTDPIQNSVEFVINMKSPRFIKSHLPVKLLPAELKRNKAKIIYVTRNPRDTCISYFHHCRSIEGYTGDFEQFCELFLDGNVPFGPFWNHVQSYWEIRNEANVLVLKYEDMINDLRSVIYKTANFFEKSLSEEQITILLDHLSFKKMKENPATNGQSCIHFMGKWKLLPEKYENICTIRSGKIGEWKEVMDAKLIERFEKWQQVNLENAEESLVRFFD